MQTARSAMIRRAEGKTIMRRAIARFAADSEGSAAIEYSLIVGCVALGILAALTSFSGLLQQIYADIASGVAALSSL
jgi:Flp pilus assembly pilin Flp